MSRGDFVPIADAVGEYWDALLAGSIRERAADLDPSLIDTIHRLRALDDARAPDPTFVNRLEHEMMGSHANAIWLEPAIANPWTIATPNGHRSMSSAGQSLPGLDDRRRALAQLATVALVLLTLLASFVAFRGPLQLMTPDEQPAVIPAIEGTPEAVLPPGVTADTILFQHVLDEIPDGADWAGVERTTLPPGVMMNQGSPGDAGVGPYLYRVEAGTVTGQVDGPIAVTRAGTATEEPLAPDASIILNPGDVAFVPPGVASHWRNTGSSPATVLDTGVSTPGAVNGGEWVTDGTVTSFEAPIDAWPIEPPPAPAELAVHELTLEPGARLAGEPEPGLKLAGVESGTLTIVWADRADPAAQTGTHETRAGNWMDVNGSNYFAKELRNDGNEPLVLLLMTVTPIDAAATPTTRSAAEPASSSGNSEVTLIQGTFDDLSAQAGWLGTGRAVLAPGTDWARGAGVSGGASPRLFLVESGELTVQADGPFSVTRAGSDNTEQIPAGTSAVISPGDRGFLPLGVNAHWRNDGATPTSVLEAWITGLGIEEIPDSVTYTVLVDRWPTASLTAPVTMRVSQRILAPGDRLVPAELPGLVGFYVESGTLRVDDAESTGGQTGAFDVPAGNGRTFGGGISGYKSVPAGWMVQPAGNASVTLLLLTLPDNNPLGEAP